MRESDKHGPKSKVAATKFVATLGIHSRHTPHDFETQSRCTLQRAGTADRRSAQPFGGIKP
jgi:hypothetical protein